MHVKWYGKPLWLPAVPPFALSILANSFPSISWAFRLVSYTVRHYQYLLDSRGNRMRPHKTRQSRHQKSKPNLFPRNRMRERPVRAPMDWRLMPWMVVYSILFSQFSQLESWKPLKPKQQVHLRTLLSCNSVSQPRSNPVDDDAFVFSSFSNLLYHTYHTVQSIPCSVLFLSVLPPLPASLLSTLEYVSFCRIKAPTG